VLSSCTVSVNFLIDSPATVSPILQNLAGARKALTAAEAEVAARDAAVKSTEQEMRVLLQEMDRRKQLALQLASSLQH